ncbi:hypothetical protein ACFWV1_26295 [Streptomyces sp. NPDC058700]|uniref:hypothetical protein n=1 Tax=Streptomyces sp. NPDC058700 TaxID=3346607 RepID=UPI0036581E14
MTGPDFPAPHEPLDTQTLLHRWPTGTRKTEMIDGVIHFTPYYAFDNRDLQVAQLVYPGRTVALSPDGHLEVHPAPRP